MNPKIVWAAAVVIAFVIVMTLAFRVLSQPPTSYTVVPTTQKCPAPRFLP